MPLELLSELQASWRRHPDRKWCEQASSLILGIGKYDDVSRGLSPSSAPCTGWAKNLYYCRTVPRTLQLEAWPRPSQTSRMPSVVWKVSPLSSDDWRLASLGISAGGIGARSAQEHAPAVHVAGLSATAALSARIWPAFDEYDLDSGCLRSDAEFELRSSVPAGADITNGSLASSRKALSTMIEARALSEFMASDQVEVHGTWEGPPRPQPQPCCWCLSHVPSELPRHPHLLPQAPHGNLGRGPICPLCGQIQDRWGDHVLTCLCGVTASAVATPYGTLSTASLATAAPSFSRSFFLPVGLLACPGFSLSGSRARCSVRLPG